MYSLVSIKINEEKSQSNWHELLKHGMGRGLEHASIAESQRAQRYPVKRLLLVPAVRTPKNQDFQGPGLVHAYVKGGPTLAAAKLAYRKQKSSLTATKQKKR